LPRFGKTNVRKIMLFKLIITGPNYSTGRPALKGDHRMSIEEIKKLMSELPLDEKDFDPYAVQMKIRIGFNNKK